MHRLNRDTLTRYGLYLLLVAGAALIALTHAFFLYDVSGDYQKWVKGWFEYIRSHGVLHAYGDSFANYTPFYTYLLGIAVLLTPSGMEPLIPVKLVTFAGEIVAAAAAYRLVAMRYGKESLIPLAAALTLPLLPTVLINGASAGQCDIWPAALLLWAVYYFICGRPVPGMVWVGLAIAFKVLAGMIAPLVLALLLCRQVRWWHLLIVPLMYLVLALPCLLEGRPLADVLLIYKNQFVYQPALSMNSANLYWFVPGGLYAAVLPRGLVLGVLLAVVYAVRSAPKLPSGSAYASLLVTALGAALLFYTMPKMHDRYLFTAEIFTFVLAFLHPRLWPAALLFQLASLSSYVGFLMLYQDIFPVSYAARMPYAVLGNGIGIGILAYAWWRLPSAPGVVPVQGQTRVSI